MSKKSSNLHALNEKVMFYPDFIAKIATTIPFILLWISFSSAVGLALCSAISESFFFATQNNIWKAYTLYWQQLLKNCLKAAIIAFVILCIVLFVNWQPLWQKMPIAFGLTLLGIETLLIVAEGVIAYFSIKKWDSLNSQNHLLFTWLAVIFLALTAWIPLAFTAWMECPLDTTVNMENLQFNIHQPSWFLFSPLATLKFTHTILASLVIGAGTSVSLCCYQLIKKVSVTAKQQLIIAVSTTFFALFLTMCIGDSTGYIVAKQQPLKMAMMQQLQIGGEGVSMEIAGPIRIPHLLSRLSTHKEYGFVPGYDNIINGNYDLPEGGKALSLKQKSEYAQKAINILEQKDKHKTIDFEKYSRFIGYESIQTPEQLINNSSIYYWSFRLMIGMGLLLFVMLGALIFFLLDSESPQKQKILKICLVFYPTTIVGSLCGWIVSEYGKTPWTVCELLPMKSAVSDYGALLLGAEAGIVFVACGAIIYYFYKKLKTIIS